MTVETGSVKPALGDLSFLAVLGSNGGKNKFAPCTPRVKRLRDAWFAGRPSLDIERAVAYTKSYQETEGLDPALRRATAVHRVCSEKSVAIYDDELIVGTPGSQPRQGLFCPEVSWKWLEEELDELGTRPSDPYEVTEQQKATLRRDVFPYWQGRSMHEYYLANLPEDTRELALGTGILDVEIKSSNGAGEVAPGYSDILLKKGWKGIAEEAQAQVNLMDPTDRVDVDKIPFLMAVVKICEAAKVLADRYADEALRLAADAAPERAEELREIADTCRWIGENPPRTLREAVQLLWFGQVLIQLEENCPGVSPGRFDQYMYPFYEADLAAGRITPEQTLELLECMSIKMCSYSWLISRNCAQYFGGYQTFQNITVGGHRPDGVDGTNDLTYLLLQAQGDVKMFQPSLSASVHEEAPEEFIMALSRLIREGTGFPAVHNEAVVMDMLRDKGLPEEVVSDYMIVGCVEPNLHGKMYQWSDGGHYNLGSAVDFALSNGVWGQTGEQMGVATGDPLSFTFEELKEAVREQLRFFVRHIATSGLIAQKAHALYLPKPVVSALHEGCVETGTDVTRGGARFNAGPAFLGTGIGDLVDSLMAVKKLVYEDHEFTMEELTEALAADFVGHEALREKLINWAPKWGNDVAEVDALAREYSDFCADIVTSYRGYTGCKVVNALYPVASNVPHGKVVGALPSGRKNAAPLADGISPEHSLDRLGPTASMRSCAVIDHKRHSCGTLLNLKLNPALIADDDGLEHLGALINGYFDNGGYHVQFNILSSDTLRKAQVHPEKYEGLIVRVAGYSAFFADLCKETQDDIIARTEHVNWG
jgi:choline trimethylamine-lyase